MNEFFNWTVTLKWWHFSLLVGLFLMIGVLMGFYELESGIRHKPFRLLEISKRILRGAKQEFAESYRRVYGTDKVQRKRDS